MGSDLLHEHGGRLQTLGMRAACPCASAYCIYNKTAGLLGHSVPGMHGVLEIRISLAHLIS